MKKIGIVTHYYNSSNYGGILQAYALCRYLNNHGAVAEQICYDSSIRRESSIKKCYHFLRRTLLSYKHLLHKDVLLEINKRKAAFELFRDKIPHSQIVYTEYSIAKADDEYDAFITGSDQVWNPILFKQVYSLSFTQKLKFSYAASMAVDYLDDNQKKDYQRKLNGYCLISVRERTAQKLLDFNSDIALSLDPVFLLDKDEWKKIGGKRAVDKKYVFTYFIGDSLTGRTEAKKYATFNNCLIVNIPYLMDNYRECDNNYGDIRLCDVSPNDFVSLIRDAQCVFTDSFHAICFSYIFKKNFYVFKRDPTGKMNSRIVDILDTLNLSERYVETITSIDDIDYSQERPLFHELLVESKEYISNLLKIINAI